MDLLTEVRVYNALYDYRNVPVLQCYALAYLYDDYMFETPPVPCSGWGQQSWILWVMFHGVFYNLDYYRRVINQYKINQLP